MPDKPKAVAVAVAVEPPTNPVLPTGQTIDIPDAKRIFKGSRKKPDKPEQPLAGLPDAPPWRAFEPVADQSSNKKNKPKERGADHYASAEEIVAVNLALYLRRPLLITGGPGTGKTSLAYAAAYELGLGEVLVWPITSRATLQQGLYHYDALGHFQDVARRNASLGRGGTSEKAEAGQAIGASGDLEIGGYLRLGPLGTALHQSKLKRPRVLLIDEIDKSDIDLPNDLLHLFEEGEFDIPELVRLPNEKLPNKQERPREVEVLLPGGAGKTVIVGGRVRCEEFPLVFLTSNNERDFPPAFLRRCLRLDIQPPKRDRLRDIIKARVTNVTRAPEPDLLGSQAHTLLENFIKARDGENKMLATDQLLNAMQLVSNEVLGPESETLRKLILRDLKEGAA